MGCRDKISFRVTISSYIPRKVRAISVTITYDFELFDLLIQSYAINIILVHKLLKRKINETVTY